MYKACSICLSAKLPFNVVNFLNICRVLHGYTAGTISHTIPIPAETVPVTSTGAYRPVIFVVCHKTHGIHCTHSSPFQYMYYSCLHKGWQ